MKKILIKVLAYYTLVIGFLSAMKLSGKEMVAWGDWGFLLGVFYVIWGLGDFWIALSYLRNKKQKKWILIPIWLLNSYIIIAGIIKSLILGQFTYIISIMAISIIPIYIFITSILYQNLFKKINC